MIVTCKLPPGKAKLAYGLIAIAVCNDRTVDVPEYLARELVKAGCSCNERLSRDPTAQLIAQGEQWETGWLMHAVGEHYSRLPKGYDKRLHAIAMLARFTPAITIS